MKYASMLVSLLYRAILKQEEHFRELTAGLSTREQERYIRSVRQFYESWIGCILATEALRGRFALELDFETKEIDRRPIDLGIKENEKLVAVFELKGPVAVGKYALEQVTVDCVKQSERLTREVECFVVLLLRGQQARIESWLKNELEPKVARTLPGVKLLRCTPSPAIPLNVVDQPGDTLTVYGYQLVPC